jgi:hypothetical protein
VDPNPANDNLWNYLSLPTRTHPRRNDLVRIDASPFQKLRGYFRWDRDYDDEVEDANASDLGKFNWAYTTWSKAQPGHGYLGSFTYMMSPNMVMDFGLGKGWNSSVLELKMGVWAEHVDKVQIQGQGWDGGFSFAVNSLNPYDSGDSFSNVLLGNFYTYGEGTGDSYFDGKYWGLEYYAQDNWHVTRKLTLDYGVRFYWLQPQYDVRYSLADFYPQLYSAAQVPVSTGIKGNHFHRFTGSQGSPVLVPGHTTA